MSFTDIMRTILPDIPGQDGFTYQSYINDSISVNPPTSANSRRSDYNDTTQPTRKNNIHGGVDIYYYKVVGNTAVSVGSTGYPNTETNGDHPPVCAFGERRGRP